MNRASLERWLRRTWDGKRRFSALLLLPLSLLWWLGTLLHRAQYALGLRKTVRIPVPVVAVGNLTVGGAGKTPVTLELARRLLDGGRRVAVVSRGYGRISRGVVLVSDGQTIRSNAEEGGDEPLWLARCEPRLMVLVGEKRSEAASVAVDLGADLVLLDDGLSHYGLHRDATVVVVDDQARFGNGLLLPAGPLRLRTANAGSADLVWWTRVPSLSAARKMEPTALVRRPSVHSSYSADRLVDLDLNDAATIESIRGQRVLGVCGIARPDGFERTLEQLGANVRAVKAFPDHHRFTPADVAEIERIARAEHCELILTTEKDAVRLSRVASGERYRAVAMTVKVHDPAALDSFVQHFAPWAPRASDSAP